MLTLLETGVRWAGAAVGSIFYAAAFWSAARASERPAGRASGQARQLLRAPVYILISVLLLAPCVLLWRPLPWAPAAPLRAGALALGSLLYFSGLGLWAWGRQALGDMFNVSTSAAAQLAAGHRLVTHGPFACVRHPMYLGTLAAALGALLVYRTWTTVFVLVCFLSLVIRARREEGLLMAEFGPEWEAYCRRVPAWLPRRTTKK